MFLLTSSSFFRSLNGFDERFFLYCEDADIGLRAWQCGGRVELVGSVSIRHEARRQSGKNLDIFFAFNECNKIFDQT